jgi:hypothetical protein
MRSANPAYRDRGNGIIAKFAQDGARGSPEWGISDVAKAGM